jgi:gluconolactonase
MKQVLIVVITLMPLISFAQDDAKGILLPDSKLEKLGDGYAFTEGPAADKNGDVYFTDQPNDRILKYNAETGEITTFMQPCGRSNGTFFDPDGNLLTCADEKNEMWSITPDGDVTVLLKDYEGKKLNGPNDLWLRPNGSVYFTDPFYKRPWWDHETSEQDDKCIYRLSPDRKTLVRVACGFKQPNGIIGTADGKKLYMSDIGDRKTYSFDIAEDGSLENRQLFCETGSDGMTIDNEGNVYLTGDGVIVFNSKGEQIEHIKVGKDWTANVCFGGKDRHLLFITSSKAVYGIKTRVHGIY